MCKYMHVLLCTPHVPPTYHHVTPVPVPNAPFARPTPNLPTRIIHTKIP